MMEVQQRREQCIFAREMAIQSASAHSGPLGNRIHRDFDAFACERLSRGIKDLRSIALRILARLSNGQRLNHGSQLALD